MEEQLKEMFARALDVEMSAVDENTSQENLGDWDSLGHLNLVTEIEKTFKIQVTMNEVMEMTNFKKVKEIVARRLAGIS